MSGRTLNKHCSAEFMKQLLPRFLIPTSPFGSLDVFEVAAGRLSVENSSLIIC